MRLTQNISPVVPKVKLFVGNMSVMNRKQSGRCRRQCRQPLIWTWSCFDGDTLKNGFVVRRIFICCNTHINIGKINASWIMCVVNTCHDMLVCHSKKNTSKWKKYNYCRTVINYSDTGIEQNYCYEKHLVLSHYARYVCRNGVGGTILKTWTRCVNL